MSSFVGFYIFILFLSYDWWDIRWTGEGYLLIWTCRYFIVNDTLHLNNTQISGQRMLQAHSVGKQICNKKDLNEISADI